MTREEFNNIDGWSELQDAMHDEEYYDDLDGTLYFYESDLVDAVEWAVRNECRDIADLRRMALEDLDEGADVWCCSPDFSYVNSLWNMDFDRIKDDFCDWMENNDLFEPDEEEVYEEPVVVGCVEPEPQLEAFDGDIGALLFA